MAVSNISMRRMLQTLIFFIAFIKHHLSKSFILQPLWKNFHKMCYHSAEVCFPVTLFCINSSEAHFWCHIQSLSKITMDRCCWWCWLQQDIMWPCPMLHYFTLNLNFDASCWRPSYAKERYKSTDARLLILQMTFLL